MSPNPHLQSAPIYMRQSACLMVANKDTINRLLKLSGVSFQHMVHPSLSKSLQHVSRRFVTIMHPHVYALTSLPAGWAASFLHFHIL
jgi:hypothetical protein